MKLTFTLIATAFALAACAVVETADVDNGREAAKAVVGPIVANTDGIPAHVAVPITDSIIDNASGEELLRIGVQGATPENVILVGEILARPAAVTCTTSALT